MKEENLLVCNVDNRKYTVIQKPDGSLIALRYDKPWRKLTGDNLILSLAQELEEQRNINIKIINTIENFIKGNKNVPCGTI